MREKELLEVNGLKKYYTTSNNLNPKKRKLLKAVDGVDFTLHEGEIFGLVGESGCGKSTLGRTLLRLHSVTAGEVVFQGTHIENLTMRQLRPMRRDMQMIFQDPYAALSPRMSIYDSVKAPLDVLEPELSEQEKQQKIVDILSVVGVTQQHMNKYPHELSGGQRQRVVIARAMITKPKFVVCDEPVSALDVSVRAQVLNLMKKVQHETGVAYLFISHDLSVVKYICETVAVMYLGKIVEVASKQELYKNAQHPYTKALMSAIPIPEINVKRERIVLQGDIPSPVNPPRGCHFHTRCPYATEKCMEAEPELKDDGNGHKVACYLVNN